MAAAVRQLHLLLQHLLLLLQLLPGLHPRSSTSTTGYCQCCCCCLLVASLLFAAALLAAPAVALNQHYRPCFAQCAAYCSACPAFDPAAAAVVAAAAPAAAALVFAAAELSAALAQWGEYLTHHHLQKQQQSATCSDVGSASVQ
jgi:hypothetical protein